LHKSFLICLSHLRICCWMIKVCKPIRLRTRMEPRWGYGPHLWLISVSQSKPIVDSKDVSIGALANNP
jgi:hypothetical protein